MQKRQKIFIGLSGLGLLLLGVLAGLVFPVSDVTQIPPQQSTHPKPKTIVVAGDISCAPGGPKNSLACRADDTANLISSLHPDAVLTAGDNQYPDGGLAAFNDAYDKTWGAFKNITYPTPGNHDYQTPEAAGYFDYFGSRAGERGRGYYSYTVGNWLMLALNSEIDMSSNSPQVVWLTQVLDSNKNACALAYWHKPRFSSGWHTGDPAYDAVWRTLYAKHVDIVVNGHSHDYERFIPQNPDGAYDNVKGITQFVSGMGGNGPEALKAPLPNLATRQNHAFGVLKLSLYPTSARYEFMAVPGQQTFTDRGTITCH